MLAQPLDTLPTQPEEITNPPELGASQTTQPSSYFQAIGVVKGLVNINSSGKGEVTIRGKTYPLIPAPQYLNCYYALSKELKKYDSPVQMRLAVYPKVTHFPKGKPRCVAFALVAFDTGNGRKILEELGDLEFKISGLWQFIPVCRTPCISVFRNFTSERLDYIKQAEPSRKVRFMKPSHLPLLWKDAPVSAFRFNPKLDKDNEQDNKQPPTYFVEIKARFLPNQDAFGFISLLSLPLEKPPRFLKASKQDKSAVVRSQTPKSQTSHPPKSFTKPVPKRDKK